MTMQWKNISHSYFSNFCLDPDIVIYSRASYSKLVDEGTPKSTLAVACACLIMY